jgi:hypothetical protein
MLFAVLDRSAHFASTSGESHFLWELFHPSRSPSWRSHMLGPEDVTEAERRAVYWMVYAIARRRRYLDKSPRNSLRVLYLNALFPTARFVFLKRDGRAVVSSLITAWRSHDASFPGTPVRRALSIPGYEGGKWKFLVPPDWEAYAAGRPLAEVCAFQWVSANEAILTAREAIPGDRWVEAGYEDFVRQPVQEVERLLDRLGVPADDGVLSAAAALSSHVTKAVTAPREGKWREENPGEVESVLPLIGPTMRRLGYMPDHASPGQASPPSRAGQELGPHTAKGSLD